MFGVTTSDDYRPVAWMGRYPVDVTTILVGLHVSVAILTAIVVAFLPIPVLAYLQFDSAAVWSGQLWRLFTYAFVHVPTPSDLLWLAVEMYMLFMFGREVERFIGRRAYIALYLILLFLPSMLFNTVEFLETNDVLHIDRTSFCRVCGICDYLSQRPTFSAYRSEVGYLDPCGNWNA